VSVMAQTPDPVARARQRLEAHGMEVSSYAGRAGSALARDVLHSSMGDPPRVAADLFVELVVIATAMRETYNEPTLGPAEVEEFLGVSRWFLNSLWHEHP
jgi:hypothetical protein